LFEFYQVDDFVVVNLYVNLFI